jgi:enamine deaminase RidA (YjgF/YER057c/UK114 family)
MSDVRYLSPETMHRNPAYSQAVVIPAGRSIAIIGGQNAVDREGKIVGKDLATQTTQAVENLEAALAAAGCRLRDLVNCKIYMLAGQDIRTGFAAWAAKAKDMPNPPTVTGLFVQALAHPDFLVEIEAIAVVP